MTIDRRRITFNGIDISAPTWPRVFIREGDVIKTANTAGQVVITFTPPFVAPHSGLYLVDLNAGTIEPRPM